MDKKPYYRQSGVVFLLLGILFLLNGLAVLLEAFWITYLVLGLCALTAVYAITSSVAIEKRKKGGSL